MTTYPYEYSANVYATIPFKYKFVKDRYWNLQGSASANSDTSTNKSFLAYPGLSMSCEQVSTSLETVSVTGGQLPDYSYSSDILGCLATVGQGTKYTNFTKVGTPTVNEMTGVATGFSGSNYLTLGVNTTDSGTWEIVVKFTTGTSNSGASVIFGAVGTSMLPFYKDGNTMYAFLSSNGSSWDIASAASVMSISTNTTYKMKAEFTGSAYNWYNWENDTWVLKRTISSSSLVKGGNLLKIGSDFSNSGASVDLSETYMKVNDVMYWTPATTGDYYKVLKNGYVNYNIIGSPTINTDTGEVTGFSTSNYLKLPTAFNPTSSSWELRFKFKTGSTISTNQQFFHSCQGTGSSGRFGIGAQIYNSKFNMFISSNGSSWLLDEVGTYTPLANTTYWVKVGWTGTEYYFEYSVDGETYTRDITYSSTSPVCSVANSYIGIYSSSSFEAPWLGTIYLADTSIYINGSEWWNPVGDYNTFAVGLLPDGVTDDGSAQTWNLFYNGNYRLNTASTMTGYTWVGSVAIPAHTV